MEAILMFNACAENTTILLPIANNLNLSNQCIQHLIDHSPCKVIVFYDFYNERILKVICMPSKEIMKVDDKLIYAVKKIP